MSTTVTTGTANFVPSACGPNVQCAKPASGLGSACVRLGTTQTHCTGLQLMKRVSVQACSDFARVSLSVGSWMQASILW